MGNVHLDQKGARPDASRDAGLPANEGSVDADEQRRADDRNLREEIRDLLDDALHVTAMGIEVQVENGEVTLLGRVTDVDARWRAEQVVVNVAGVREVQNFLVACRSS